MLFPLPSKLPSGKFSIIYVFLHKTDMRKTCENSSNLKWMLPFDKLFWHLRTFYGSFATKNCCASKPSSGTNLQKKTRENSNHISPFDIFRRLNLQRHFTVHLRWRTPSRQSHRLEHIAQCPQRCSPDQAGTPHQPFQTERYLAQCGHCLQTIKKSRGRCTGSFVVASSTVQVYF